MYEVILSIDPGKKGAVAAIQGDKIILLEKTPVVGIGKSNKIDPSAMVKLIEPLKKNYNVKAYIESVHSMPGQGVSSMFTFGKGYGMWIGILAALKIPFEEITPQAWKKLALAGTDKSKASAILKVKQLFPDVNLKPGRMIRDHDGMADAILIAIAGGLETWQ